MFTRLKPSALLISGLTACSLILAAMPPARAQPLPPALAVLDFQPKGGVSDDEASIISDRLRAQLFRSGRFQLMERANMLAILKEQGFQQTQNNCESTSCSVEVGKLLAVRHLMTGSVSKLGSIYTLSLRIVDVEGGMVLHDAYRDCRCSLEDVLTRLTGDMVQDLPHSQSSPQITSPQPERPTPVAPSTPVVQSTPAPTSSPLDPNLAERIAGVPESERWAFYRQREIVTPAASLLSAVPLLPFGYLYLDEGGKFWITAAVEVASVLFGVLGYGFLPYGMREISLVSALALTATVWGYTMVDGYLLAEQKNQELKQLLQLGAGSEPEALRYSSTTFPLLQFQARF